MNTILEIVLGLVLIGTSLAFGGVQPIASVGRFTNPHNCDRIVVGLTRHFNRSWEAKPLTKFMQNTRRYRLAFRLDASQGFVIS